MRVEVLSCGFLLPAKAREGGAKVPGGGVNGALLCVWLGELFVGMRRAAHDGGLPEMA